MVYPLLYKRSSQGKVSTWYVETNKNEFRTVSGFTDGLKVTSGWTICEGKNIGKKNSTTPEKQAEAEAKAMFDKRKELGYWENIKDIDTPMYFEPMLAKDYNDYKSKINFNKTRIFIQPKLDGLRCVNYNNIQQSRKGKLFVATPHLNQSDVLLDGELYNHSLKNDFNEIISLCRKTKPTQEDIDLACKNVEYWIYDYPEYEGTFSERYSALEDWFLHNTNPYFKLVPTYQVFNESDVAKYHSQFLEEGFEGSIIRIDDNNYENKRSKSLLKYKNWMDDEFTILGVTEGIGNLSNKVGTIQIQTKDGVRVDSAVNGTHGYLAELWLIRNQLIGKEATVKFFGYTNEGSIRFPKVISINRSSYE